MKTSRSFNVRREVEYVCDSLRSLDRSLRRLVPRLTASLNNDAQSDKPSRRLRPSPKARASLVLQGRYMGYMRRLKPRQRAQVRKVKEARGVRAAIARARRFRSQQTTTAS